VHGLMRNITSLCSLPKSRLRIRCVLSRSPGYGYDGLPKYEIILNVDREPLLEQ
jgi:hypothetical protein